MNNDPDFSCIITFTLSSMEEIHSACQEAVNALPSRRPVIEMTIPSVLDKTISPPGSWLNVAFQIYMWYLIPSSIFLHIVSWRILALNIFYSYHDVKFMEMTCKH